MSQSPAMSGKTVRESSEVRTIDSEPCALGIPGFSSKLALRRSYDIRERLDLQVIDYHCELFARHPVNPTPPSADIRLFRRSISTLASGSVRPSCRIFVAVLDRQNLDVCRLYRIEHCVRKASKQSTTDVRIDFDIQLGVALDRVYSREEVVQELATEPASLLFVPNGSPSKLLTRLDAQQRIHHPITRVG